MTHDINTKNTKKNNENEKNILLLVLLFAHIERLSVAPTQDFLKSQFLYLRLGQLN